MNIAANIKDNAEQFAEQVLAEAEQANPHDKGRMCHGGPFATVELGNSGTASMNIVQDKKEL